MVKPSNSKVQETGRAKNDRWLGEFLMAIVEMREQWRQRAFHIKVLINAGLHPLSAAVLLDKLRKAEAIYEKGLATFMRDPVGTGLTWEAFAELQVMAAEQVARICAESRTLRARIEESISSAGGRVTPTAAAGGARQAVPRGELDAGATSAGPSNSATQRLAKQPKNASKGLVRKQRKPK